MSHIDPSRLAALDQRRAELRESIEFGVQWLGVHDADGCTTECGLAQLIVSLLQEFRERPDILAELTASCMVMIHEQRKQIAALTATLTAKEIES